VTLRSEALQQTLDVQRNPQEVSSGCSASDMYLEGARSNPGRETDHRD
jgi:hypothetical protein